MCFAPQRRALFRHLNFQKWSEHVVFCAFWLRNVLRATTACLASLLFDPPEPQIIGKTQCFATFLPFRAPGSSFFWDFLFFDPFSSSLLFSDSSRLCFSSVHIVGSLTSKLPSTISYDNITYMYISIYMYIYIYYIYIYYIYILYIYIFSRRYDYCDSGLRQCWLGLTRLFLHDTFPSASPGRKLLLETRIAWNHVTTLHRTVYNSRLHHLVSSWNWLGLQVPWTMCEFRFASGWDSGIFRCGFRMIERERERYI